MPEAAGQSHSACIPRHGAPISQSRRSTFTGSSTAQKWIWISFEYETFEDLYKYCFNVASAVGLVCLQIFGFSDERAKKYAEQCGIAFQLTNILRDVKEDAESGRIYLPIEDLRKFDYTPEELRQGVVDERFRKLMRFEAERAREYYVGGTQSLLPLMEESSQPALWAMIKIYERILDRIVEQRFDVFRKPIRLASTEKISIALKALAMRFVGRPVFRTQATTP